MKKRSFFERLTGSVNMDDDELSNDEEIEEVTSTRIENRSILQKEARFAPKNRGVFGREREDDRQVSSSWNEEPTGEGELSLDVFQTSEDIIVKAMIPGVRKDDIDISISRDSITIRGSRKEDKIIPDQDYVVRELYWGTFSRTVQFPHEVDIEHAEATENQGMLTIKLPRIDKERQAKLRIKSV